MRRWVLLINHRYILFRQPYQRVMDWRSCALEVVEVMFFSALLRVIRSWFGASIIMSSQRRFRQLSRLQGLLYFLLCSGLRLVSIGGVMMWAFKDVRARLVRDLLCLLRSTLARELDNFTRKRNARDSWNLRYYILVIHTNKNVFLQASALIAKRSKRWFCRPLF